MRIRDDEKPRRYEIFQVSFAGTVAVFGLIAIAALVSHAALWDWWKHLRGPARTDSKIAWTPADQLAGMPIAPLLQTNPAADWASYNRQQTLELHSVRWIDQSRKTASVPIETAISMILSNGLPQWSTNSKVSPIELQWQRAISRGGSQ